MVVSKLKKFLGRQMKWDIRRAVGVNADDRVFISTCPQSPPAILNDDIQIGLGHFKIGLADIHNLGINFYAIDGMGPNTSVSCLAVVPAARPMIAAFRTRAIS